MGDKKSPKKTAEKARGSSNESQLNELLDSALEDLLETQANAPSSEARVTEPTPSRNTDDQHEPQEELEKMFKNLLTGNDNNFNQAMSNPEKFFADALKNLANVDPIQHDTETLSQTSAINDAIPQVFDLMRNLISRELLYPALKELSPKYDAWLGKHKDTLSSKDLARFNEQNALIKEICKNFDNDQLADEQRFEKNLELMEKMQSLGAPPDELVSNSGPFVPGTQGLFG